MITNLRVDLRVKLYSRSRDEELGPADADIMGAGGRTQFGKK